MMYQNQDTYLQTLTTLFYSVWKLQVLLIQYDLNFKYKL